MSAGHTGLIPHFFVKGAAAAIDFYKAALGAVEKHRMPFGHDWSFSTPLSAERTEAAKKKWDEWQAQQQNAAA